jgi:RNA 2',3'-cyclic 3'-phosphodiesterase
MRLFLALWPDGGTRAAISASQHAWTWPATAALVAIERLHLTLHFLGSVAQEQLPRIVVGLRVGLEPFEFTLEEAEVWPNSVAVLQPQRTPPEMGQLHRRLADALRELELPVESRPFRPHVTLARRARGAVPPVASPAVQWQAADGFVLARSLPGGSGYQVLERFD